MSPQASDKTPNKLSGELSRVLPHLQLDAESMPALAGCDNSLEALDRLGLACGEIRHISLYATSFA